MPPFLTNGHKVMVIEERMNKRSACAGGRIIPLDRLTFSVLEKPIRRQFLGRQSGARENLLECRSNEGLPADFF